MITRMIADDSDIVDNEYYCGVNRRFGQMNSREDERKGANNVRRTYSIVSYSKRKAIL